MQEDLRSYWGEALRKWSVESLGAASCPEESIHFLVTVGLPTDSDWHFDLETPKEAEVRDGLLVVGHDGPMAIGVNDAGEVLAVESSEDQRLVNSSLPAFVESLTVYHRYREEVRGLDEQSALDLIDSVEEQLRSLDASSLSAENYWVVILEQMRDGLL